MHGKHFILMLALLAAAPQAHGQTTVTVITDDYFQAPLSRHGEWTEVSGVGRAWRPAKVQTGWRPYANGQWIWTDAGWFWKSDEPWAWATYHYGRWSLTANDGWVWIPGKVWAPSWVTWREGGGYVGWAPMGPGDSQDSLDSFVFVNQTRFVQPIQPSSIVLSSAVGAPTVALSTGSGGSGIAGPPVAAIQQATGTVVPVAKVSELRASQETAAAAPAAAATSADVKPAPEASAAASPTPEASAEAKAAAPSAAPAADASAAPAASPETEPSPAIKAEAKVETKDEAPEQPKAPAVTKEPAKEAGEAKASDEPAPKREAKGPAEGADKVESDATPPGR